VEFWDNVGDPVYLLTSLPDCLCIVSLRRYSPLRLKVVENRTNVNVFGPNFFGGMTQLFYGKLLARFTVHRLAKFY